MVPCACGTSYSLFAHARGRRSARVKHDQGVSPALTPATRNGNFRLNHAPNSGRKWQDLDKFSATDVSRDWSRNPGPCPGRHPPVTPGWNLMSNRHLRRLDFSTRETIARSSQVGKTHVTPVAEICALCHGVKEGHAEPLKRRVAQRRKRDVDRRATLVATRGSGGEHGGVTGSPAHGSQPGAQAGRHALEGLEVDQEVYITASRWQIGLAIL